MIMWGLLEQPAFWASQEDVPEFMLSMYGAVIGPMIIPKWDSPEAGSCMCPPSFLWLSGNLFFALPSWYWVALVESPCL